MELNAVEQFPNRLENAILLRNCLLDLPALERFPKGVTRLSDKKRDQAKKLDPFPIPLNWEWG